MAMKLEHKRLLQAAIPPAAVALLRFGGGAVLELFGMGWRCGPRYAMDFLLMGLMLVTAVRLTRISFDKEHSPQWMCAALLLTAVMFLAPLVGFFVVHPLFSLSEEVVVQNGQTMVKEYRINGGAVFYYYAPVNGLVHGAEIEHDGPW